MATADELLMTVSEPADEILVVDLETRIIEIPTNIRVLGVESDDDVRRLHFRMPRYYGEVDLSEFNIRVNFKNGKQGDLYFVNDVVLSDDDEITFSWLVDRTAFSKQGEVTFSLCMKKFDDEGATIQEFNTTVASLPVLEGLETDKLVIQNNPSAFDSLLYRLYAVEAVHELGKNGYYTIVKVTENDEGILFSIVDQDGNVEASVRHGKDGYTPVKGVDYYTDAERNDFKTGLETELKTYVNQWSPKPMTVTLVSSDWADNEQTVTATGVTSDTTKNIVMVSPEPSLENYNAYNENAIRCVSQGDDTLTFQCESVPTINVIVNVVIYYATGNS